MKKYLSKFRPASRLEYASMLSILFVVAVQGGVNAGGALCVPPKDGFAPWFWVPMAGVLVLAPLVLVLNSWRRLLDLGEPPRRAWLALIPLYNLYFIGRLVVVPGANPPPEHGGGPAPRSTGMRVLYWLVITIWIFVLASSLQLLLIG